MSNTPDTEEIKQVILEAPIGEYIGDHGTQVLAENADCEIKIKDNEFLFHNGDLENHFYIISSGRLVYVKERKKKNKQPHVLHILEKGDLVAELSFIDDTPHTTSCMALGDATVICFKADDIRPLIIKEPQFMFDFMRAVIKRVHRTVAEIGKQQMILSDYISSNGKGRI